VGTYKVLSWNGIPTGVRATGDGTEKRAKLPIRFQAAVDAVATATGRTGTKEYLADWKWSEPVEREGTAAEIAASVALEITAEYSPKRIAAMRRELIARHRNGSLVERTETPPP